MYKWYLGREDEDGTFTYITTLAIDQVAVTEYDAYVKMQQVFDEMSENESND